jgi:hypothetical protein
MLFDLWWISGGFIFDLIFILVAIGAIGAIILAISMVILDAKYRDKSKKVYPEGTSKVYKRLDKQMTKCENSFLFNEKKYFGTVGGIMRFSDKMSQEELDDILKRFHKLK